MTRLAWPAAIGGAADVSSPGRLVLTLNLLAFAGFAAAVPGFASAGNLQALLIGALPLLLLATGQTFVLVSGGIDLSLPAVTGLASIAGGLVMGAEYGWIGGPGAASVAGLLAMVAAGAAAGALNGACVGWLRMPAFMVTLTVGMFAGGLAVWLARVLADSETIYDLPPGFVAIGGTAVLAAALAGLSTLAAHGLLARTQFGRFLQAVGYNPRVALVSGVPVERVVLAAYVASGVCAALAAVLLTGSLETASPIHGRQLLLDVIGATVIGGTSLAGGRGSVAWTALGVLFLAIVGNGLTLLNLSDFVITICKGLLILAAALLDAWRVRARGGH